MRPHPPRRYDWIPHALHWHAWILALLFIIAHNAAAQTLLIEAESFEDRGGWVIDQQFMDQMGSSYLLAHGLGRPVRDAVHAFEFPQSGSYRVFVRNKDWAASLGAPGSPGRFKLVLNGKPLEPVFGASDGEWHWQDGGVVEVDAPHATLALHDLTGFEGRCDAVVFTVDAGFTPPNEGEAMAAFRRKALGLPETPPDAGTFDLVVVGGGIAGTAAAISAARLGVRVALIQNRPVLGGNNSSEVRVHIKGKTHQPPYPALGGVVEEIRPERQGNAQPAEVYEDQKKLNAVLAEKNIHLFLNMHAFEVEKTGKMITAVIAKHFENGRELRFPAPLFADCTGDGNIGYLAGADYRMGREGKDETGESRAPERADRMTMGASVMWYSEETDEPSSFPECPWALPFTEASCEPVAFGEWTWETGLNRDQITEFEAIRDHGFRAVYGNWAYLKNHGTRREEYANRALAWVAYIAGKRESRRLLGDVILQQQDIIERKAFPDACVTTTWTIDLHYPDPENTKHFPGEEFKTIARHTKIEPYPIPFRCLYSRNIDNLMMAGRCISVTHVALGTVRVQGTTGMMGEVVGMAASLCKKHGARPRHIYRADFLFNELKALMKRGVGGSPEDLGLDPPDWLETAGPNLARLASPSIYGDKQDKRRSIIYLIDGFIPTWDNDQRFLSANGLPVWIWLSFTSESKTTISAARIVSGWRNGAGQVVDPIEDFSLQYMDRQSGGVWIDIPGTKVTDNKKTDWSAKFDAVETRSLRLLITRSPGDIARIWELELYHPAGGSPPE